MKLTSEERATLSRLADGDMIAYSQDGEMGWFTDGNKDFVGDEVISLRRKGLIEGIVLEPENYRGMSERDVISPLGRSVLDL